MAILDIVKYGENKILNRKAIPVKKIDDKILKLVGDMVVTMYEKKGVGLAANQVNSNLSILVFDITPDKKYPTVLINPVIIKKKGKLNSEEGCLSIPGVQLTVKRNSYVKVKALGKNGKEIEIDAQGPLAIVIQHEYDHLCGKTMIDRLPLIKKLRIKSLIKSGKIDLNNPKPKEEKKKKSG